MTAAFVLIVSAGSRLASADPSVGLLETWSGTSLHNWGGGSSSTNPGTGGVGGAGDGFLLVATPGASNLGTRSNGAPYVGDWIAAGVDVVKFWLDDVGADDPLEIHFSIGNGVNLWQTTLGFSPPENAWGEFTVALKQENFTQIVGLGTFDAALHSVDRIHFRHDHAPFMQTPDAIQADFGIDNLLLTNSQTPTLPISWGRIKARYR